MKNVKVMLQTIPDHENPPNGFWYINCHMVFDIKMENLQRKVCQVGGGHMAHTLDAITCSSVVTRETVCIALTMEVLHDLEVKGEDVLNANLMAPNREKI